MTDILRRGMAAGSRNSRDEEKKRQEKRDLMLSVFQTPSGVKLLTYLLEDLGYFDPAISEGHIALRNYAAELIGFLGATRNTLEHTRSLIKLSTGEASHG